MFDLNDIWRVFRLENNRRPSQWRGEAKDAMVNSANLHNKAGRYGGAFATLQALYGYAMWIDVEFYMVVVEAFAALTRGDTEEAQRIANQCVSVRNKLREHHDAFTG